MNEENFNIRGFALLVGILLALPTGYVVYESWPVLTMDADEYRLYKQAVEDERRNEEIVRNYNQAKKDRKRQDADARKKLVQECYDSGNSWRWCEYRIK